jgi:hypothetical protein
MRGELREVQGRLVERGGGQLVAGDAVGKPGIVLDARAGADLAAGRMEFDHNRVESLGRRVDGRGEAGRTDADDHPVVQLLVGARVQTDVLGQLHARGVEVGLIVVTGRPPADRAVGVHEDGEPEPVGNPPAERAHEGVVIEIDPLERDPVPTGEVAQVLHVRRAPPADEMDVAVTVWTQLDHARLPMVADQQLVRVSARPCPEWAWWTWPGTPLGRPPAGRRR